MLYNDSNKSIQNMRTTFQISFNIYSIDKKVPSKLTSSPLARSPPLARHVECHAKYFDGPLVASKRPACTC